VCCSACSQAARAADAGTRPGSWGPCGCLRARTRAPAWRQRTLLQTPAPRQTPRQTPRRHPRPGRRRSRPRSRRRRQPRPEPRPAPPPVPRRQPRRCWSSARLRSMSASASRTRRRPPRPRSRAGGPRCACARARACWRAPRLAAVSSPVAVTLALALTLTLPWCLRNASACGEEEVTTATAVHHWAEPPERLDAHLLVHSPDSRVDILAVCYVDSVGSASSILLQREQRRPAEAAATSPFSTLLSCAGGPRGRGLRPTAAPGAAQRGRAGGRGGRRRGGAAVPVRAACGAGARAGRRAAGALPADARARRRRARALARTAR
jgi:hypothetical protein